jgi:hypothetical protein
LPRAEWKWKILHSDSALMFTGFTFLHLKTSWNDCSSLEARAGMQLFWSSWLRAK